MSNQVKIFVRTYIIKKTQPLRLSALPLIYIKEVLDIMKEKFINFFFNNNYHFINSLTLYYSKVVRLYKKHSIMLLD